MPHHKRNIFYCSLIVFVFCTVLFSCKRQYEKLPLDAMTDEYLWDVKDSNGIKASQYLMSIYHRLPSTHNRIGGNFLDAASDDAISSVPQSDVELMATGGITIFNNPDDAWSNSYGVIRMCTNFLNNFRRVPLKSTLEKQYWLAEARVIRAFFYWELVRRYGGIPLLGEKLTTLQTDIQLPRNTYAESIDYIVKECDKAIDSLRPDPVDANNQGRWTKAGAMALKSRVLLYAASPLYNGQRAGNDLNGYASFDANRWKLAADAAKRIMNLNVFQLEKDLIDVFIKESSPEVIFARQQTKNTSLENLNGPPGFSSAPGQGLTSPTQELVDAYTMRNLKPITDPASGYNPNDPYSSRDRRFYATIFYNGYEWLNSFIQTFDGGISRPGGTSVQTRTSYYSRKMLGRFEKQSQYFNQVHDYIYFRLGEVLLNYAEAANEFSGPTGDVYDALDQLLNRAYGDGTTAFHLTRDMSKDSMRTFIRNQRRAELAMEEHRYWDIRRWKLAENVYNKPLHGMVIKRSSAGEYQFTVVPVLNTKFNASKHYAYPIPYNEMISNRQMVQNPGWETPQ